MQACQEKCPNLGRAFYAGALNLFMRTSYRGVTENDVPLFNSSMHDVWDQCMVHVDNDCLSDAPAECAMYYKLKDMNTLSWTSGHCTSSFCYRLIRIPC